MKLIDKKAEKKIWMSFIASIPFLVFVVWNSKKEFGLTELSIVIITILIGIGIIYITKRYANK